MLSVRPTVQAAAVALFTLVHASSAVAQDARRGDAVHVDLAPVIDGVVDDRAWQQAEPLIDFEQAEPLDGQPATEPPEVRIVYDDTAIYIGVVCHDSDPSQIVTTDTRRDTGLNGQDSV